MMECARVPEPLKRIRRGTVQPLKRGGWNRVPRGTGTVTGTMGTIRLIGGSR